MAVNNDGLYDSKVMAPKLTDAERELRDRFVQQYIVDRNEYKATIRLGYLHSVASSYSTLFMNCPYVQKRIIEEMSSPNFAQDEKSRDSALMKNTLRQVILSGANKDKVSASKALGDIHGINTSANKKDANKGILGGVMVVPAIADIDAWEKEALASQGKLVEDTRHS